MQLVILLYLTINLQILGAHVHNINAKWYDWRDDLLRYEEYHRASYIANRE